MSNVLNVTRDYIISKKYPLKSFITNDIPILSVFATTKSKLSMPNIYSPKQYLAQKHLSPKLLLIYEPELLIPLEYLDTIKELRNLGYSFIAYTDTTEDFTYLKNPIIYSINQEFYVKALENEKYYFLYYICKKKLFNGSVFIYAEKNEYKRVEILLEIFIGSGTKHMNNLTKFGDTFTLSNVISKNFYNNVLVFGEKKIEMSSDRIIYICEKITINEYKFDYNQVVYEKYRLDDLIRNLTKNVLLGKKKVNLERFNVLKCDK